MTKLPKYLSLASKKWVKQIQNDFILEQHHQKLLILCAESWDKFTDCQKILEKEGLTYKDRFGQPHARPEVKIMNDSKVIFCRCLRELNLDVEPPDSPRPPQLVGRGNLRK